MFRSRSWGGGWGSLCSGVSICSWYARVGVLNPGVGGDGDGPDSGVSIRSWNLRAGVVSIRELGGACGSVLRG